MLGRVAKLHYMHGLTHQEIAGILGVSRIKVTRLLAEARRTGVVEIRIHSDEGIFTELEVALRDRFGLAQAWVAPSFDDPEAQRASIGTVGATCLEATLAPGMTVTVGLSETVGAVAPQVHADAPLDAVFIPAMGSRPASDRALNPHEVAHALGEAFRAESRHLPAPIIASSPEAAEMLRREPDVQESLALAAGADVGMFGVGGIRPGTGLLISGAISADERQELTDAGAVGDLSAAFFDAQGKAVRTSFERRVIGLGLDEILRIPVRIALAGGADKVEPLLGALAGELITALVTDKRTAEALLERAPR